MSAAALTETADPMSVRWLIPMEAVRAMATGDSIGILTTLALRQAQFRAHATLVLGVNGFFADVRFETPAYPGREQSLAVTLAAVPQENALDVRQSAFPTFMPRAAGADPLGLA